MFGRMMSTFHDLAHAALQIDYPHSHWWMPLIFVLLFGIVPAWSAWHVFRFAQRFLHGRSAQQGSSTDPRGPHRPSVERYVLSSTRGLQIRLVLLSALTIPITWFVLELPKHIINHALSGQSSGMAVLGLSLGPLQLLFLLCAGYFLAVSANSLFKYLANTVRGQVTERIVRRLRLDVIRSIRGRGPEADRATLVAIAIQECEPIGYFGGSLLLVPLIQGGTLLVSFLFLLLQDVALALAAVMMLPVQLTILPRLQRRVNAKMRERVYATRCLSAALGENAAVARSFSDSQNLRERIRLVTRLERLRLDINELKSRMKSLYNYLSSLTPFFFFTIGGYLVLQKRLSLGALVAALAAYREITPALRELFDFAQNWSDARARYAEVTRAVRSKEEPQIPAEGLPRQSEAQGASPRSTGSDAQGRHAQRADEQILSRKAAR